MDAPPPRAIIGVICGRSPARGWRATWGSLHSLKLATRFATRTRTTFARFSRRASSTRERATSFERLRQSRARRPARANARGRFPVCAVQSVAASLISLPGGAMCVLPAEHYARHSREAARDLVRALARALNVTDSL